MLIQPQTFDEALAETRDGKRHLLLGNGFSIALFPDRFRYGSLLEEADFSKFPRARKAFDQLGTTDFEVVINALRNAVALLPLYFKDATAIRLMGKHAEALKDLLVQAIAGRHPERPSDILENQYTACRKFLAHFVAKKRDHTSSDGKNLCGCIYTLNYDLLLYWTLLHDDIHWIEGDPLNFAPENGNGLKHDDGFRTPENELDAPYVTWDAEGAADRQNIHFLHGALHLYDHGSDLQKKCWERSGGVPLIDQSRSALDEGKFPLFVSEGDSKGKLARIRHSGYLQRSLKSFAGICRSPTSSLFVYGHSLAPSDEHALRQIEKGKIGQLYVSLYGDPRSSANKVIVQRAHQMTEAGSRRNPLRVSFFDADSTAVWG